ncbi:tetratricopeptide repeat protein (macronuclear) [Tetrahymena thermophila SB210]|uniref:Tetratricopeptide repeat protein n=1 Tax=Tetrahymena thermophila (strain SB210) TaxID=312017 RepID=Q24CD5_TETTS|nr:tetratricopeptide repeat protein [Tetrahymena thermophila SB210]EAS05439.2 tetratricopeptide repeat protein [Tetrahymena thermophila SB210]|eukprot:XP_001025684.2 tetratricopeptide repeat protein [Tetrahymena thermophila SB210]
MDIIEQLDIQQQIDLQQVKKVLFRKANFQVIKIIKGNQENICQVIVQDQTTQKQYTLLIFPLLNDQGNICHRKLAYAQQRSQILSEINHPNITKFYGSFQLQNYFFVQLEKFEQTAFIWCEQYQQFLFYKILVSNVALQILSVFKYLDSQNLSVELLSDQTVFINDIHQIKIWNIKKKNENQNNQVQLTTQNQIQQNQQLFQSNIFEFSKFIQTILEKQEYLDYYEPFTQHKYQINLIQNIKEKSINSQNQIEKLIAQYNLILQKQLKKLDENQIHKVVQFFFKNKYPLLTQNVDFLKDILIVCNLKINYKIKYVYLVCQMLIDQEKFQDALQYIHLIFDINKSIYDLDLESFQNSIQNGIQNRKKYEKYVKLFLNLFKFQLSGYQHIEDSYIQQDKQKRKINQNQIQRQNSYQLTLDKINIFKIITDDGQSFQQNICELYNSLSQQYLSLSSLKQAIFFQKKSVLLNKQNEQFRKYLAELYNQNFDFKSQIKCLQLCFKASQDTNILNNITDSLIKLNLFEMAKQICLFQISQDQKNDNALIKLGIIYLELKNLQKAKTAFQKCININQSNFDAYLYLSFYFFQKQHYFRSIQNILKFSSDQKKRCQKRNIIKMNHAIISKKLKETYNIYQSEIMIYRKNSYTQGGYLYLYPKDNKYDTSENIHNEIYIRGIYNSPREIESDQSIEEEDEYSDSVDDHYDDHKSEIDCSSEQRLQIQSEQLSNQTIQKEIQINFDNENKQKQGDEYETKSTENNQVKTNTDIKFNDCIMMMSTSIKDQQQQQQQDENKQLTQNLNNTLNKQSIEENQNLENDQSGRFQQMQKQKISQENEQLDTPDQKNNQNLIIESERFQDQMLNIESQQIYQDKKVSAVSKAENQQSKYYVQSKEEKISSNSIQNDENQSNQQEMKVDEVNQNQITETVQNVLEDNNHQSGYYQSILNLNNYEQQQTLDSYTSIAAQQQYDDEIQDYDYCIKNSCNLENQLFKDLDIHNLYSLQSKEGDQSSESTSNCKIHVNELEKVF